MRNVTCAEFANCVTDLAAGDVGDVGDVGDAVDVAPLRGHAAACPACALTLRREVLLVRTLDAMTDAPVRALPVPALPPAHALPGFGVLRRLRTHRVAVAAAAVAACLVVGIAAKLELNPAGGPGTGRTGTAVSSPRDTSSLREAAGARIVDEPNPFPAWDDRLLELTAGAEHVAARRPAEER